MATTTEVRAELPVPAGHPSSQARFGGRLIEGAAWAGALSMAYVVGHDGSPFWQVVRVALVACLGAGLLAVLRTRSRAAPVLAFTAGTVTTAVGIGFGLPHLAKTGLTAGTVAGVVALAAGALLTGAGAGGLLRAAPRWWRVPVIPALLLSFFVVLWALGQGVAATNVPPTPIGDTTPADRGLIYRDVRFPTSDGVTLSGWYVPSTNGAAIALLHGAGSTRSNVLDHAAVLARHGYGVVLFDARGHGRSGGRAMDFGWRGDTDTAAAVSFLQAQPEIDPVRIGAVGLSMGGEEAIGAAAADERIRAVVAEGATNRVAEDKEWLSDRYGWRGAVQERIESLVYATVDLLTASRPPVPLRRAVAMAAPRPVLLIAGSAVPGEEDAGRHIAGGAPGSAQLWVASAGHTDALADVPAEWERRVMAFLDAALGNEADPARDRRSLPERSADVHWTARRTPTPSSPLRRRFVIRRPPWAVSVETYHGPCSDRLRGPLPGPGQ